MGLLPLPFSRLFAVRFLVFQILSLLLTYAVVEGTDAALADSASRAQTKTANIINGTSKQDKQKQARKRRCHKDKRQAK